MQYLGNELATRDIKDKVLAAPYRAEEYSIIIEENMFLGPVQEYYITDTY